jgi:phage terminase large subunit-like protein
MPISENGGLILQTPMHRLQCLNIVDEIIEGLDERGINELLLGSEGDLDFVIDNLVRDTFEVMYTGKTDVDFAPKYTERLSESIEETLRTHNLTYFITSVLPDFQLSWHHLEWCDLVYRHKKLCIEAARDHGKCEAVGTPVLMFDGRIKKVEEIKVGDLLMGVDSTPRKVTAVHRGWDDHMYRIDQSKGDSYTVNSRHINTCIRIDKRGSCLEDHEKHIVDIDMPTLLSYSQDFINKNIRTFKVSWEFPYKKVKVDPYFLGLWLGDGRSNKPMIINKDKEVIDFLKEYSESLGLYCRSYKDIDHYLVERGGFGSKDKNKNCLYYMMDYYNLFDNKHIPDDYLYNSKDIRIKLLAGLLDSDGTSCCNSYSFSNFNKRLLKDVHKLCNSLGFRTVLDTKSLCVRISGKIDEIPVKIERKKIKYDWKNKQNTKDWGTIDGITPSVVSSIKITDVGRGEYVSITTDGDHRFLLGDGTVTHNSYFFSNAYAAWKLYGYSKPRGSHFSARPTRSNSNRGYLFSFSLQQSVDLMEILKGTIEGNDVLRERLFPDTRAVGAWASTNIVCKNGARLTCKGFGSSVRGAHPFWIVVDDGLKDNVIYSQLQRQKSIDYFHSVIMNMLVPGGQIVVVGTPFHASDLYGDLKTKKGWFVIEYPAIFPDGRILWPHRWSFFDLLDKRATQGNIIFSRENLCRPITNEASIFPLKVLERSLVRMENYVLVRNRDDFPIKFNKVVVGCDFAISANVGSDYTVFTTWGVDDETGERWLLNFHRQKGMTYNEQIQMLRGINARFRPDSMILEQNTFQQIFVQEADRQGLPVVGHTTGIDKYDLKNGWPGLSADFERGKIHIPVGDDYSRNVKDLIFSDLGSVAFTDKGLQSVGDHDDISSSFWLAKLGANLITTGFKYAFL